MQTDMETVAKMRQAPNLTEYGCKTRARIRIRIKNKKQTAKRLTKAVKHTPIGKTGNQRNTFAMSSMWIGLSGGTNKIE
ncbi:hypothetical protein GCM10007362_03820 [Saccharibacillus endophyticus]|uniref:Uncharacterized protein n=1 Tax=Saccharibacillus endophyticus TaxID=2060666 RepID=A0ABQ1ZMD5_9BACL|nr:hypothetical protein GCM10007362_03820 [Saccharibacillus endophyticus]